ncbi:MAG: protein-L-isoaspartate(D-aspartate) O-methyltransferase [Cyclobacteriaceae bacterium]
MKEISNLIWICAVIAAIVLIAGFHWKSRQEDQVQKRKRMVDTQIRRRGVKDIAVLSAMSKVERHLFVPSTLQHKAYDDTPLSIGHGQTISQPYIVAYMTEVLELSKTDKVLEVGTGSGYQAAVLAELCDSVFTIEIVRPLGVRADKVLKQLRYSNIYTKIGDGYLGWPEHAPFDAIIVTCAPFDIPPSLKDQLAEGGRMIIPAGSKGRQQLYLLRKVKGKLKTYNVLDVLFVPMVDSLGNKY